MSEATTPKEQDPSSTDVQGTVPTTAAPAPSKAAPRGRGLALLALLVGAAGAGAAGWGLWQLQAMEARAQQQLAHVEKVGSAALAAQKTSAGLKDQLLQLPSAAELETRRRLIVQLQGDQQLLNQRLETVLGASRQDWRLAEAEHLLRLASLRLSALQDINSATALVQAADEILQEQDDPAAFAAREQLAKSLEALRSTENPDRTGLFLQLGALREQALQLNVQAPDFKPEGGVLGELVATNGEQPQWWQRGLQALAEYFRLDIDTDSQIKPLLAGQALAQVHLFLSLALEQAQWGALHGQTAVYRQALIQARDALDGHFDRENPSSRAMRVRIDELLGRRVAVTPPDLGAALNAVQAYIQAKQSARAQLELQPEAEGQAQESPQ